MLKQQNFINKIVDVMFGKLKQKIVVIINIDTKKFIMNAIHVHAKVNGRLAIQLQSLVELNISLAKSSLRQIINNQHINITAYLYLQTAPFTLSLKCKTDSF